VDDLRDDKIADFRTVVRVKTGEHA